MGQNYKVKQFNRESVVANGILASLGYWSYVRTSYVANDNDNDDNHIILVDVCFTQSAITIKYIPPIIRTNLPNRVRSAIKRGLLVRERG